MVTQEGDECESCKDFVLTTVLVMLCVLYCIDDLRMNYSGVFDSEGEGVVGEVRVIIV